MDDINKTLLGIVIVAVFLWRFIRTRQLYLTSLQVKINGSEPIPFKPHDLRSFIEQALMGRRTMGPASFFVRGVVFAIVAACLLPFKEYEPHLYWFVVVLIALYVQWSFIFGIMLLKSFKKRE